jgi:hypothetical protein
MLGDATIGRSSEISDHSVLFTFQFVISGWKFFKNSQFFKVKLIYLSQMSSFVCKELETERLKGFALGISTIIKQ